MRVYPMGGDGPIVKTIHYGFKYGTRCAGQGCPICKAVIKRGKDDKKGANRFSAKKRGVVACDIAVIDTHTHDVISILGEMQAVEIGTKMLEQVTERAYIDELPFDGSCAFIASPRTTEIGDREVTFLDHDTFDVMEVDESWPALKIDEVLFASTIEFNENFPKLPNDKILEKCAEEVFPSGSKTTSAAAAPQRGKKAAPPTFKKRDAKEAGSDVKSALSAL